MRGFEGRLLAAVLLLLAGCGRSLPGSIERAEAPPVEMPTEPETPVEPIACPDTGDLTTAASIHPELLPNAETLFGYERQMVELGPRFTGSPALRGWHDLVAGRFAELGLEVLREPMPIDWWEHKRWSLTLIESGAETEIPVAAYYPYSGHTDEEGVTAELVDAGTGLPQDFVLHDVAGKIAYLQATQIPTTMGLFYASASYIHDPDNTITPLTDYTRMSLSFLLAPQLLGDPVGSLPLARQRGAVAAVIALPASADNAAGQYTPFMGHPGSSYDVPTLFVDRDTGAMLKTRIANGAQARLRLVVDEHKGESTDDIIATLPGMSDEVVVINTHSDGPSASEENGGIALMALAQYFSALPKSCRQRTLVFVMTPGHFHGGIGGDTDRFLERHPEIVARAVASLTPEHLGQMEWLDDAQGFHASGMVEPSIFFGSNAPAVQALLVNAVRAEDLRRTMVARPIAGAIYFGVGSPMNSAGIPNGGYITGPHSMLSWADNQHLDKTDAQRMAAEVRTFARIVTAFDGASKDLLCLGMTPSGSHTSACFGG